MCLHTKQKWWRWATKDIKCYKVMKRSVSGGGTVYYTPYQDTEVHKSVIEGKCYFRATGVSEFRTIRDFYYFDGNRFVLAEYGYEIDDGAIHAFQEEKKGWGIIRYGTGNVLFECIIPKGTRYAIGLDGDICAKKIKFIKELL